MSTWVDPIHRVPSRIRISPRIYIVRLQEPPQLGVIGPRLKVHDPFAETQPSRVPEFRLRGRHGGLLGGVAVGVIANARAREPAPERRRDHAAEPVAVIVNHRRARHGRDQCAAYKHMRRGHVHAGRADHRELGPGIEADVCVCCRPKRPPREPTIGVVGDGFFWVGPVRLPYLRQPVLGVVAKLQCSRAAHGGHQSPPKGIGRVAVIHSRGSDAGDLLAGIIVRQRLSRGGLHVLQVARARSRARSALGQ